ncbi:MAG: dTMP kinase [Chloroflexota bacterium]
MFVTLEGPEGSGKTTHISPLAAFLRQQGYKVFTTREPGGTSIGDQIRKVILDQNNTEIHPRTEALLLQASRAQLVEQVIRPHLKKGFLVISDRYADSTIAYQGYGHQINLQQLQIIISFATGGLRPDLTVLLDIEAEEGLRRRTNEGNWNRLDAQNLAFHQRVREGYLQLAKNEPERWVIINASRPINQVQADIRRVILERLKLEPVTQPINH